MSLTPDGFTQPTKSRKERFLRAIILNEDTIFTHNGNLVTCECLEEKSIKLNISGLGLWVDIDTLTVDVIGTLLMVDWKGSQRSYYFRVYTQVMNP